MSYDLHLTRASDWSEAPVHPITSIELVAACHQVGLALRPDGADAFQLGRSMSGEEVADLISAHVVEGQITLTPFPPDQDVADRVTRLAGILNAQMQGDDGEIYECAPVLRPGRRRLWRRQ
ncbi:hypothetical protein [Kocuria rosea]|uniref:hypothetical protein n=1 Tax=Kocuria rosea TaxID=1275 RepID=UPI000B02D4D2|nr:hypothetical protein [Kocuria polaris]